MTEEELERLSVRVVGDSSSYESMTKRIMQHTAAMVDKIHERMKILDAGLKANAGQMAFVGEAVGGLRDAMGGLASQAWSMVAPIAAATFSLAGLKTMIYDSVAAWQEAQMVEIKLSAALRANDRDVKTLLPQYKNWASAVQRSTMAGDEQALTLVSMAEGYGLTGRAATKAAEDALALADATGQSAETMLRITQAVEAQDLKMAMSLAQRVQGLNRVATEEQFLEQYQKKIAIGNQAQAEMVNTLSGRWKQLKEVWGNLQESAGEFVASSDAITGTVTATRNVIDTLNWANSRGGATARGAWASIFSVFTGGTTGVLRGVAGLTRLAGRQIEEEQASMPEGRGPLGPTREALANSEKLRESLERRIAALRAGTDAAATFNQLAEGRLDPNVLQELRDLQMQHDDLAEAIKREAQFERDLAQSREDGLRAIAKQQEELDVLFQRNAEERLAAMERVKKSVQTPYEKLQETLQELENLRARPKDNVAGIDDETYARAVKKATDEYERLDGKIKKVTHSMRAMKNAAVGTAEAFANAEDYLASIGGNTTVGRGGAAANRRMRPSQPRPGGPAPATAEQREANGMAMLKVMQAMLEVLKKGEEVQKVVINPADWN